MYIKSYTVPQSMSEIVAISGISYVISGNAVHIFTFHTGTKLIKNPQLLLCDEPTGALDSVSSRELLVLLEQINEKYGTTILLVTHNGVIRHMAHKVLQLKDGRIVEEYENRSRVGASDLEGL